MKSLNLKIALIALLSTAAISAQDMGHNDVPTGVRTAFEQAYPEVTDAEWEKEGDRYKAEFEINNEEQEIWYAADGNSSKTEREIPEDRLPQSVKTAISNNYPGYEVDAIEITEEGGTTTYEIELEKGWNEEKEVIFDAAGKVLNETED